MIQTLLISDWITEQLNNWTTKGWNTDQLKHYMTEKLNKQLNKQVNKQLNEYVFKQQKKHVHRWVILYIEVIHTITQFYLWECKISGWFIAFLLEITNSTKLKLPLLPCILWSRTSYFAGRTPMRTKPQQNNMNHPKKSCIWPSKHTPDIRR